MRRIAFALLGILVFYSFLKITDRTNFQLLVQDARQATVYVEVETPQGTCSGSGFIVDEDGWIITAAHVIEDAVCADVVLSDGSEYNVKSWYVDKSRDTTLLRILPIDDLPTVELTPFCPIPGDKIFMIGSPFGIEFFNSLNVGYVSNMDRSILFFGGCSILQMDINANPGNSGGPVFDMDGNVIGILTGGIGQGLALGIPYYEIQKVIKNYVGQNTPDL